MHKIKDSTDFFLWTQTLHLNKSVCRVAAFVCRDFNCKLVCRVIKKVQVFCKADIQKGKKKTLFGDTVYKTGFSNIEQLPAAKLPYLYS